jgi:hypothetical protein
MADYCSPSKILYKKVYFGHVVPIFNFQCKKSAWLPPPVSGNSTDNYHSCAWAGRLWAFTPMHRWWMYSSICPQSGDLISRPSVAWEAWEIEVGSCKYKEKSLGNRSRTVNLINLNSWIWNLQICILDFIYCFLYWCLWLILLEYQITS